jgi:hypothetical protein
MRDRNVTRADLPLALWMLVGWALIVAAVTCGCANALKATYASLDTTERLVIAAAREFPRFDEQRQAAIIAEAKTNEEARARLYEWHATQKKLSMAIEGAHASVQLARDTVNGIAKGVGNPADLATWAGVAVRVYQDLTALLKAVGVTLGGLL